LSCYDTQYVLDKSTSTWSTKTWTGLTELYGRYIWTDGDNIYYSKENAQYVLGKNIIQYENVFGRTENVKLKLTDEFTAKTWNGLANFSGSSIWTDGDNIYYSDSYVLDKSTSTWNSKTWNWDNPPSSYFDVQNIWTDGENIYYSYADVDRDTHYINFIHYVLDKSTSTWNSKTWSDLPPNFKAEGVWTDGENIYFDYYGSHYVLNKSTSTWSEKTWNGNDTNINGTMIWSDGDSIYCSFGSSDQYVLDKSTSTWSAKTWNGLTDFGGNKIWSDGDNIYYSSNSKQYILDKSTSTWSSKTWNGLSSLNADLIWKDGNNIYYSSYTDQYILSYNYTAANEDIIDLAVNNNIASFKAKQYPENPANIDLTSFTNMNNLPEKFFKKINSTVKFLVNEDLNNTLDYYVGSNELVSICKPILNYVINGTEIPSKEYIEAISNDIYKELKALRKLITDNILS
jgi:hypothetical protein